MTRPFGARLSRLAGSMLLSLLVASSAEAGVLVIAYNGEGRAALVDADSYRILATLPTGAGPHEVRVSADGRYAYVALSGGGPGGAPGNSVTVLDLKSRKVKAKLDLGSYTSPHDVRVSRDGRRIWVVCAPSQTVLELDSDSGKLFRTYKTGSAGSWFLEVTPDGRKIYTPNLEGKSVSVIDRATGAAKVIPFEAEVYGIDITPDGRQVWVSGPGLAVIDTARDEVIARLKTSEPTTGRVRLTPDGRRAVVGSDSSTKVSVFDVRTRRLTAEIETGTPHKVISVSGDGRRAFLTNPDDDSVTVLDLVAGKKVATIRTGRKPDGIAWAD
ncbi:MAG TPA: YncE family protein [Pyrinomonadaceae bacterium]|nr:YncE family protein [Pyrinomonadaceae bacterium]